MNWNTQLSTGRLTEYRLMPKVDLHRHLEGSLRLDTLLEIARQHPIPLPPGSFAAQVQVQPDDPLTFANFLSKFQLLRYFYCSPEVIMRLTREVIEDAAEDGGRYLELRFTPVALTRVQGFPLGEVMDWVCQAAAEASQVYHLPTRLIVSVNRHEAVALAECVARLAAERARPGNGGIVGLDLAGNEAEFSAAPFAGVFREARQSGLRITVHAGEWGGAGNVREAIEQLGAERIGHGVRVIEDAGVLAQVRERGVTLETCLTSNVQSGVVSSLACHPLPHLLAAGLKVTLNTDDPAISGITLSDEYRLALEDLSLPPAALQACLKTAVQASFLPEMEKTALLKKVTEE